MRIGARSFAYTRTVFCVGAKGCENTSESLRKGVSHPFLLLCTPRLLTLEQSSASFVQQTTSEMAGDSYLPSFVFHIARMVIQNLFPQCRHIDVSVNLRRTY